MDVVTTNKMDGLEALSQIRANPKTRGIPIVTLNPEYLQLVEKPVGRKASTMNLRVLVAEDHPDLLDLLSRQLWFCGYQVATAKNGAEAVAMAVSEHPDVILMDIVMPKMDGLEAVSQIRANPKTEDIPVLALTAWLSPNSRQNYMARGFNDCLSKPFTHDDLFRAIDQLLRVTEKRSEPSDPLAYLAEGPN
jgi:CheY-like chemotaxis protein